ncbi:MAG: enoyl-CoA hydratase/isomerase family protein [Burkholderiaceae bacterium]|nr:enoyl-CoA hydratase/isomerase family protein [Rhodoferax sp.]MCP5284309.1 enoyl-CoA hydratase/isomerase family protein [Burkholderiaceae bacterium]
MADMTDLLIRQDGPVLHLTLNRPAQRNPLSVAMVQALRERLAAAEADGTTRVLVLRGAGGHFCSGGDIADMAAARARLADDPDAIVRLSTAFGELCVAVAGSPLATVAVLEGTVMGGGFGLACVTDVALAADNADFRLPETSLGLLPAQIGPFLVERLGYSEARRLAVTGARLGAAEALMLRLVHEVHPTAALDAALTRVVQSVLRCAPGAVAATKAVLARARQHAPASLVHEAAEAFSAAVLGDEGAEGTAAFLARRPPRWAPPG